MVEAIPWWWAVPLLLASWAAWLIPLGAERIRRRERAAARRKEHEQ